MSFNVGFGQVVVGADRLMGVKAVWGRSQESVMCFGSRGDASKKDKGHFSQARRTAERSLERPYFVTIGGGEHVSDDLRGRTIELVRATGVFGETEAFVRDPDLTRRLSQWPVAIIVSEVYSIVGEPLLVEDLGFADRKILENAYDSVVHPDHYMQRLWTALKDREIRRRWDVQLPDGFRDPGKVQMCGTLYPRLIYSTNEGKRVWRLSLEVERDIALKRAAKSANCEKNGGIYKCEACDFRDHDAAMFDAHHLRPIAAGERNSRVDDLAVLCPTCHRWSHAKADDRLSPVSVDQIAAQRLAVAVTPT